jgi:hypothetical protein
VAIKYAVTLPFRVESCYMKDMHVFERDVNGRRYRIAAQSVWDPVRGRSVARQVVLGPATAAPVADLGATRTVGTQAVGDVGALIWIAEQLDLTGSTGRADLGAKGGPSVGELAVAVAIHRAEAGPGRVDGAVPRLSCLPASAFSGQAFHRVAGQVTDEQLEQAQIAIANAAVARFGLSADVLAFDTTNFDTHIATVTPGDLARRGHAKSKRSDLRVVGLGVLVSETGHVPLLYRTYSGNSSDQAVLTSCLEGLKTLHQSLDDGEGRKGAQRTLVRDGGFWSPQLELDLDVAGYYSLISLPLGHAAAERALQMAAKRGAMKPLTGKLSKVRVARVQGKVGDLDRTLVVVESQELLEGQKRGIAVALRKAKAELNKLDRLVATKRISRSSLEQRIRKTLAREHLSRFVVTEIGGDDKQPTLRWHVDAALRRQMEKTRLGRRVLCTDHHQWSNGRIVQAFRGQWQRRRTIPPGQEGWCGALGTVASVGGRVPAPAHLCDGTRTDAGESGEDRARNRRLSPRDDGRSRRDPRHTGAYDDGWAGASRNRDDSAGTEYFTASGC